VNRQRPGGFLVGCATLAIIAGNAFGAENSLPLRTENVIGLADVLRIAVALILLLGATSAALWWYQRRYGRLPPGFSVRKPEIEVIARQRLSNRTQVFVIRRGEQEFLVTESPAGSTTLPIPRDNTP
jgi:flagellar biogenesis protein FliO